MHDFLFKAKSLEQYFKGWSEELKEPCWFEGLKASRKWVALLEQGASVEQVKPFAEYLNNERINHGNGWHDLSNEVRNWIYFMEKDSNLS